MVTTHADKLLVESVEEDALGRELHLALLQLLDAQVQLLKLPEPPVHDPRRVLTCPVQRTRAPLRVKRIFARGYDG